MEKKFARVLSFLLNPLVVPTLFMIVVFKFSPYVQPGIPEHVKNLTVLFVFLLTFVLPFLSALGLLFLKLIKSLEMHDRRERVLPMIIISVFFYIAFYSLKQLPFFQPAVLFMLGSTVLVLLCLIFNYFFKISLHMTAWGGFAGALAALGLSLGFPLYFWLFGVIFISGVTGYARLKTKAHTPAEVYSGWLLGVVVMMSLFLLL